MKKISVALVIALFAFISGAYGQENKPKVGGVLFTRYEYFTDDNQGKFDVRNARLQLKGALNNYLDYTVQYDFSDAGTAKVVDAFVKVKPMGDNNFSVSLGQMRAPFTLDAHRGPDSQFFANRSFISKIGGVRDIGIMAEYNFELGIPMTLQGGFYNGNSFSDQKKMHSFMMYQVKYQANITKDLYFSASHRNTRPDSVRAYLWDAGLRYKCGNFMIEGEYMRQSYAGNAFDDINFVNLFVNYDIPVNNPGLSKVSLLARYDYMSDYSDGKKYNVDLKSLPLTTSERHRATAGITLSIAEKAFKGDLRLNYEKYFYKSGAVYNKTENDKIVVGLVVAF